MEFDVDAARENSITEFADDLLLSLRRWLCDVSALLLINADVTRETALPDEIRKNTVAMELILTEKTFCEGKKKDREAFVLHLAEVGRGLDVAISSMTAATREESSALMSMKLKYGKLNMITCVKVVMSVYSAYQWLPQSNKLKRRIQKRLGLQDISIDLFSKYVRSASVGESAPGKVATKNRLEQEDEFLFPSSNQSYTHALSSRRVSSPSPIRSVSDNSLWGWEEKKHGRTGYTRSGREYRAKRPLALVDRNPRRLMQEFSVFLREVICEFLLDNVAKDTKKLMVNENSKFREEVIYVYSTWRSPHLLLDYYRMHSSSPDILRVYGKKHTHVYIFIFNMNFPTSSCTRGFR